MSTISPLQLAGLALVLGYIVWLMVFFSRFRDRILRAIGRRLRVDVEESSDLLDAGTYGTADGTAALPRQAAIWLADAAVTLFATVGVAALVFIPAFLVAEQGLLLPLEGRLTGRRAALVVPESVTMRRSAGTATARVSVRNEGRAPLQQCQVGVADYEKRNGYLHGTSAWFDLAQGDERRVELPLTALRASAGTFAFRIELECAHERLLVKPTRLRVVP
jgi:hypothetical protein